MVVGKPITREDYSGLNDDELMALLDERIRVCFHEARSHRQRAENCRLPASQDSGKL